MFYRLSTIYKLILLNHNAFAIMLQKSTLCKAWITKIEKQQQQQQKTYPSIKVLFRKNLKLLNSKSL